MPKLGNRRAFLSQAVRSGAVASLACIGATPGRSAPATPSSNPESRDRKLIIVVFGGGTRASESIDDPSHRHIPRLWEQLRPRGTLLTNMRVEHKVVHPNCTAGILTGHREWDDLDWNRPVAHPSIFEIYRKEKGAADTTAWAFVYASILAQVGCCRSTGYGLPFAANVVEPPTIPRTAADEMSRLLNRAAATGSPEAEGDAARQCAQLARDTSRLALTGLRSEPARAFVDREYRAWKSTVGTTSHDAFLANRAMACMRLFTPSVLVVAFGEIDCAHYGSWTRYVEAIRRTDELTWQLWQTAEQLDAYRGRTLMLILPDHGRELERPGGTGFIHHGDFYTGQNVDEGCRRVWMLAIGPGVTSGRTISDATSTFTAAATGLEYLGLQASPGAVRSILPLLS